MKSIATCLPPSAQNHNYKHSILIAGFPVAQKPPARGFFRFCRANMHEGENRMPVVRGKAETKEVAAQRRRYVSWFVSYITHRTEICFSKKVVHCSTSAERRYVFPKTRTSGTSWGVRDLNSRSMLLLLVLSSWCVH